MRILVTGITGFVGGALAPRLAAAGHDVVGLARDPARAAPGLPALRGDVLTGAGLLEALEGVQVAYYLVHSMEGQGGFADRDRQAAGTFARAARRAGVRRIVYLGGLVPEGRASPHLASRLEVEELLLAAAPESVALRASIVVAARSRSFRFLVRLVERLPVLPLPAWREHRTRPIDGRDVLALLAAAATRPGVAGRSLDAAGPDVVTYEELIGRIADALLVERPPVRLSFAATPLASRIAATVAGEDHGLVGPLMESLDGDLLPREDAGAAGLLGVRLHSLGAAIERALRDWEASGEALAAR